MLEWMESPDVVLAFRSVGKIERTEYDCARVRDGGDDCHPRRGTWRQDD